MKLMAPATRNRPSSIPAGVLPSNFPDGHHKQHISTPLLSIIHDSTICFNQKLLESDADEKMPGYLQG